MHSEHRPTIYTIFTQFHPVSHTYTHTHTHSHTTKTNYPLQTRYTAVCAAEKAASQRAVEMFICVRVCSNITLHLHRKKRERAPLIPTTCSVCPKKAIQTHNHTLRTTSSEMDRQKIRYNIYTHAFGYLMKNAVLDHNYSEIQANDK